MPVTWIEPASGRSKTRDHAQRRRLAGAVGAKQRVELAAPHRKVEMVDRGAVESLNQAADFEGEYAVRIDSARSVILRWRGRRASKEAAEARTEIGKRFEFECPSRQQPTWLPSPFEARRCASSTSG